tara:strand:+ start:783 stop:1280 length:498 start_codon:yes stop_codon:yes gene_type:complete
MASFSQRLYSARFFLGSCFVAGIIIALWDPSPRFVFTFAIGLTAGILILGPHLAAVLYALRIGQFWNGNLCWPIYILATVSTALLIDYFLRWSQPQFWIATSTVLVGTVIGHDATLAALELRFNPHFDLRMVATFPLLIGLAVIAGYSILGFLSGMYTFAASAIG